MITIPNADRKIWDIEQRTAEIAIEMASNNPIVIQLNAEGPCAETLGLYTLLDDLCKKFNFDKRQISIETCNQVEFHDEYQIKKIPPLYIHQTQQMLGRNQSSFQTKTFDADFKTFGLFVSRSNYLRLWMTSVLYNQHSAKSLITFHYNNQVDFHRPHLGFDQLMQMSPDTELIDQVIDLIKNSPLTLEDNVETYPICSSSHLNIAKVYHKFFVEIVCETYYTGNTFYPTEKIWRPLVLRTPFIIQGPTNYYNNLRKLGFKTFHEYWDEGFGEDPYDYQVKVILETVQRLSKLSNQELNDMYNSMQPILDYNYKHFMNLTVNDFKKIWKY
jgi:hypothetical protein